jgi:hypothetical protein
MMELLATNYFGDTRGPGLAGPLALLIIVLLGVATVFLIKSMNRHLRKLPGQFPPKSNDNVQ